MRITIAWRALGVEVSEMTCNRDKNSMKGKGVSESGQPGVSESGQPGVSESGQPGVSESGRPGISESGQPGVSESGQPGVYGATLEFLNRATQSF